MRQQKIDRKKSKKQVQIVNQREAELDTSNIEIPNIDPKYANQPVRAIYFTNVDGMDAIQIRLMLQELNRMFDGAKGGVHYMIPVQNGKIGQDIVFEEEWLSVVNKTCEVKNGEIVLKDGAKDVHVIRQNI